MWPVSQADNLHEMPSLIVYENKINFKISSAACLFSTLRVNMQ